MIAELESLLAEWFFKRLTTSLLRDYPLQPLLVLELHVPVDLHRPLVGRLAYAAVISAPHKSPDQKHVHAANKALLPVAAIEPVSFIAQHP